MTGMRSHTSMAIGWMIVEIFIERPLPALRAPFPVKGQGKVSIYAFREDFVND